MTKGFTTIPRAGQSRCDVCDSDIPVHDLLLSTESDYTVCRSIDCRNVMGRKFSMSVQAFETYLELNKKMIRHRRDVAEKRKKYIARVTEKERQENSRICHAVFQDNPELDKDSLCVVAIPSGYSSLVSLDEERINNYTEHLNQVINEAALLSSVSEVVHDEHFTANEKLAKIEQRFDEVTDLRTLSDRLCCVCKGGCCVTGANHAYVSVCSVRRYMDSHPNMSPAEILELYVSNLPTESIENSCINQTDSGCVLPRELRSDICNGYYCDPLKEYQQDMAEEDEAGLILAVQRSGTVRNRFEVGISNDVVGVTLLSKDCDHVVDWEKTASCTDSQELTRDDDVSVFHDG